MGLGSGMGLELGVKVLACALVAGRVGQVGARVGRR